MTNLIYGALNGLSWYPEQDRRIKVLFQEKMSLIIVVDMLNTVVITVQHLD